MNKVNEARSNPDKNSARGKGHSYAAAIVEDLIQRYDGTIGVSMTNLPKIGINPSSKYETPIAVCFYPAEYYVDKKSGKGGVLPFMDNAHYIQIFRVQGNMLRINEMDTFDLKFYATELLKKSDSISNLLDIPEDQYKQQVKKYVFDSAKEANVNNPGGMFWYVVYKLSQRISGTTQHDVPRASIIWNKILRIIGIQAVLDNGGGILHPNEPYQGMVFDPTIIHMIETVNNTSEETSLTADWFYGKNVASEAFISNAINYFSKKASKSERASKKTAALVRQMVGAVHKNPALIKYLPAEDVIWLATVSQDRGIAEIKLKSTILQKWPLIKRDIDIYGGALETLTTGEQKSVPGLLDAVTKTTRNFRTNLAKLARNLEKLNKPDDPELQELYQIVPALNQKFVRIFGNP